MIEKMPEALGAACLVRQLDAGGYADSFLRPGPRHGVNAISLVILIAAGASIIENGGSAR